VDCSGRKVRRRIQHGSARLPLGIEVDSHARQNQIFDTLRAETEACVAAGISAGQSSKEAQRHPKFNGSPLDGMGRIFMPCFANAVFWE